MWIIARGVLLFAALTALLSPGGSQQPATARFPQFENDQVRVWRSVIAPHLPLTMHRHDHPRVIVALSGGTMKIVEEGGRTEQHEWETGKAYWLPSNPANRLHADANTGERPIEVMVVELKHEK
jgi:beta-alanine degradation protein BauB